MSGQWQSEKKTTMCSYNDAHHMIKFYTDRKDHYHRVMCNNGQRN